MAKHPISKHNYIPTCKSSFRIGFKTADVCYKTATAIVYFLQKLSKKIIKRVEKFCNWSHFCLNKIKLCLYLLETNGKVRIASPLLQLTEHLLNMCLASVMANYEIENTRYRGFNVRNNT